MNISPYCRLFQQGVPTWTCADLVCPEKYTAEVILAYYVAQLRGGARILMYCQARGREFIAIEARNG